MLELTRLHCSYVSRIRFVSAFRNFRLNLLAWKTIATITFRQVILITQLAEFPVKATHLINITTCPRKWIARQECIPVGCVPPAVVAVGGVYIQTPPIRHPLDQAPPGTKPHPGPDPPCEQNS